MEDPEDEVETELEPEWQRRGFPSYRAWWMNEGYMTHPEPPPEPWPIEPVSVPPKLIEKLKLPCNAEGFPGVVSPCRQLATVFKVLKSQQVELGFADGRLMVQEEREGLVFTWALTARLYDS